MTLWLIGDIVFLLVIIPAVVLILASVLAPATQIKTYVDDITEHGAQFGPHLDSLRKLERTRELVKQVNVHLERYVRALDQVR